MNRVNFAFGSSPNDEHVLIELDKGKPKAISTGDKRSMKQAKKVLEEKQNRNLKKYVVRKASNLWT